MDWATFIEKLPSLFVYFVPGFLFLKVHEFICTRKNFGDNQYFIFSIVISFIITTFTKPLIHDDKWLLATVTILASVFLSFVLSLIYKSKYFNDFLLLLKINKTVHASIWEEIKDIYDVYIKIFIPSDGVVYFGLYKGHEEKETEPYILITDYEVHKYDGTLISNHSEDRTRWATISTKDISRVEIIYSDRSNRSIRPVPQNQ